MTVPVRHPLLAALVLFVSLDALAAKPKAAPQVVDGNNLAGIECKNGSTAQSRFAQTAGTRAWTETAVGGATTAWTEERREPTAVTLRDAAGRRVRLDLGAKTVTVTGADGASSALCTITKVVAGAQPAPPAFSAEAVFVQTGPTCPSDARLVTLEEATAARDAICPKLGPWDIANLANGAAMDGSGYGCNTKTNQDGGGGSALCVR